MNESNLEIIHCWRTKGEKRALNFILDLFMSKNPGITIIDNALSNIAEVKATVKSRIINEKPPDTFQNTFGPRIAELWKLHLNPVNELFEDFPLSETLEKWAKVGQDYYLVPLNIHRDNNLWYNKKITGKMGIIMPLKTVNDFFEVCEEIKQKGYIPFAFGTKGQTYWLNWILEWFIVSSNGNGSYLRNFYNGKAHLSSDKIIKKALMNFKRLWGEYVNPNWNNLTWDGAGNMLLKNEAAFNLMGDWQKGHFIASGWKPLEDFGFQTAPQTNGVSIIHGNCFSLTKGAPHPNVTLDFLKIITTIEAQQGFCKIKSASPVRSDCPYNRFDPIQKTIIELIKSDKLVSNVLGTQDVWINKSGAILEAFCRTRDIDATVEKLDTAYKQTFSAENTIS